MCENAARLGRKAAQEDEVAGISKSETLNRLSEKTGLTKKQVGTVLEALAMKDLAIETKDLTKDYGNGRGIFDLGLRIAEGEVFGFLGPNGAGKTTTIRLLMGLIHATRGSARIFGLDCDHDAVAVKRKV